MISALSSLTVALAGFTHLLAACQRFTRISPLKSTTHVITSIIGKIGHYPNKIFYIFPLVDIYILFQVRFL